MSGKGKQKLEQEKILKLPRQIKQLKEENDFLKKLRCIFQKTTNKIYHNERKKWSNRNMELQK